METDQRTLRVTLTEEQPWLYLNSPTFRHGVDSMIRQMLPTFLAGLEQRAEEVDAETRQRIAMMTSGRVTADLVTEEMDDG